MVTAENRVALLEERRGTGAGARWSCERDCSKLPCGKALGDRIITAPTSLTLPVNSGTSIGLTRQHGTTQCQMIGQRLGPLTCDAIPHTNPQSETGERFYSCTHARIRSRIRARSRRSRIRAPPPDVGQQRARLQLNAQHRDK